MFGLLIIFNCASVCLDTSCLSGYHDTNTDVTDTVTRPVEFISLFLVLHLICYTVNPDSARNRSLPGKTVSGTRLQRHGEQWRQQHNQTVIKVAAH